MPIEHLVTYYKCCPHPYTEMIFTVYMQRKSLFYMFTLVMPVVIINIMSLLVFLLPPASGEKLSLSITVLLTLTVFMLVISESMPTTSESIPLLGMLVYFRCIHTFAFEEQSCILGNIKIEHWVYLVFSS